MTGSQLLQAHQSGMWRGGNLLRYSRKPSVRSLPCSVQKSHTRGISRQVQANAAAQILKVSAEELQKELSERTQPLVIDFYATWCGPCLLLAKELEKVAEEVGDSIKILKVDTDENLELSNQLRIEGLPTMVFVGTAANKPAIRIEGLYPAQTIVKIIKEDLFEEAKAEGSPAAQT